MEPLTFVAVIIWAFGAGNVYRIEKAKQDAPKPPVCEQVLESK